MKFPSIRELGDAYVGVCGENVTDAAEGRRIEAVRQERAARLAVAKHYLREVSVDEVKAIGTTGRRFRIDGEDWWLSEAFLDRDQDPTSVGVELYLIECDGSVVYLRRPQSTGQRSLHEATRGGRVAGNLLTDVTGEQEAVRLQ